MPRTTVDLGRGVKLHMLTPGEENDPEDQSTYWKFVVSQEGQLNRDDRKYAEWVDPEDIVDSLQLWLYNTVSSSLVDQFWPAVDEALNQLAKQNRRPFHETIVFTIRQAYSRRDLGLLARLIKSTKIPKNHDAIIAAWNERLEEMGQGEEDLGVPAELLEQKQESEQKANKPSKAVSE